MSPLDNLLFVWENKAWLQRALSPRRKEKWRCPHCDKYKIHFLTQDPESKGVKGSHLPLQYPQHWGLDRQSLQSPHNSYKRVSSSRCPDEKTEAESSDIIKSFAQSQTEMWMPEPGSILPICTLNFSRFLLLPFLFFLAHFLPYTAIIKFLFLFFLYWFGNGTFYFSSFLVNLYILISTLDLIQCKANQSISTSSEQYPDLRTHWFSPLSPLSVVVAPSFVFQISYIAIVVIAPVWCDQCKCTDLCSVCHLWFTPFLS